MADQAELRAALAEAVDESKFPTDESVEDEGWDIWETEGGAPAAAESAKAAAGDETAPKEGTTPDAAVEAEAQEGTADDPPMEYWGTSLEGLSAEQRAGIIEHFAQQDSTINKLQARLNAAPVEEAPAPAVEADEVTDEDLLRAVGIDPDGYEVESLPHLLPILRHQLNLESQVEALVNKDVVREVTNQWTNALDELEGTYGKLPGDRAQVLKFALDERIGTPFETYFRLAAPAKREVEEVVATARRETLKREQSGGLKPRSSTGTADTGIKPGTSLKDAVRQAMVETEKETGHKWRNLMKRVPVQLDE